MIAIDTYRGQSRGRGRRAPASEKSWRRDGNSMKKAAVINDLSSFGKCSLTAAIPVLSTLGVQCVPLPTAVLTGQTGYAYYHCTDLTEVMPLYIDAWKHNDVHFDAIYSGYLTGYAQIRYLEEFIDTFYEEGTFLLIDPVMGDDGVTYPLYSGELLEGMKKLARRADMITPNLTEACLLADVDPELILSCKDTDVLLAAAGDIAQKIRSRADKPQDVIITGIKSRYEERPAIYTIASACDTLSGPLGNQGTAMYQTRSRLIDQSFSGTGDLFASAICGLRLNHIPMMDAMETAQRFVYDSIWDTVNQRGVVPDGVDGILFEKNLIELRRIL